MISEWRFVTAHHGGAKISARRLGSDLHIGVPAASLRKFTLVYCTQDQPLSSAVRVASQRTPTLRSLAEECVEHKNVVKMTFAKGASLKEPSGLFNSSLEGNAKRAIDFHVLSRAPEGPLALQIGPFARSWLCAVPRQSE